MTWMHTWLSADVSIQTHLQRHIFHTGKHLLTAHWNFLSSYLQHISAAWHALTLIKTVCLPWELIRAFSTILIGQNRFSLCKLDYTTISDRQRKKTVPRIKAPCPFPALLPLTVSLFILQIPTLPQQAKCQMFLVHWAWESGSQITHSKIVL